MVTDAIETAAQMVNAADHQLAELEAQRTAIAARISELERERETIAEARANRLAELERGRAQVEHLQHKHQRSESYAKLALSTAQERSAVKTASAERRAWSTGSATLAQLARKCAEVDQQAQTRETAITLELVQRNADLDGVQDEISSVQTGRDQAHAELGESRCSELTRQFLKQQEAVEELRRQLVEALADEHDQHQAGLAELAAWPDHQRAFERLVRPEDATTRMMEASLAYLESVFADGRQVAGSAPLASLRRADNSFNDIWSQILLYHGEIVTFLQRQPHALEARRESIQSLLAEYRAHLVESTQEKG